MNHLIRQILRWALAAALVAGLAGCATNPVTGRRELHLLSEAQEISLGQQNYVPMQQSQGGDQNAFPELTDYVQGVGQRLAEVSDRPHLPYEFVVLNNRIPNAWALPGGKIAVNSGLLVELHDEAELAAVLGHEIVHAAARHGAKNMERSILMQAGLIGLGIAAENHDYRDVIMGAGGLTASLIGLKYSRGAELEADRYGIKYMAKAGYDPAAAVDLQEMFVRLSEGQAENWLTGLFASHPPSRERVEKNRERVASMPPGGVRNREEYEAAVADLRRAQPAYEALAQGYKALEAGDAAAALRLANRAIALEPRESQFHLLAAKAHAAGRDPRAALGAIEKALARNDHYFDHYLQRGLIRQELGQTDAARQDLALSARLLPTAQANTALGLIALEGGRRDQALHHFALAASTDSPAGQQSLLLLTRLELPEHPERFIELGLQRDRDGYLVLAAGNRSVLPIRDLVVRVEVYQPNGRLAIPPANATFPHRIGSNQTAYSATRIGPFPNTDDMARRIRLRIVSVEPAE